MADVTLQDIYDSVKRDLGAVGSGPQRFDRDFIAAARATVRHINREADLETSVTVPDDIDSTLTNLDEDFTEVVHDGILYHLMKWGRRPKKDGDDRGKMHYAAFKDGVTRIYYGIFNDQTNDDTDDDTHDIIGLGTLGDE